MVNRTDVRATFDNLNKILNNARHDFYSFCLLFNEDLYSKRASILYPICKALQDAYYSKKPHYRLVISVPPRTGKTTTINLFIAWSLGRDFTREIIRATYSQSLTIENNIAVKNILHNPLYQLVFPNQPDIITENRTSIVYDGHHRSSLYSTSVDGSSTGFGCQILISDDLYNGHTQAFSPKINERVKTWYLSAYQTRLDGDRQLEILIGTRWSTDEIVSEIIDQGVDNYYKLPALQIIDGKYKSFCDDVISVDELLRRQEYYPDVIFNSMYQQAPQENIKALINRNTFDVVTEKYQPLYRYALIDTKTTGTDNFVVFVCDMVGKNDMVITDVFYTDDVLTDTLELQVIEFLKHYTPHKLFVEVNKDYSLYRNLKRELEPYGIRTFDFTTTKNKQSKIIGNSRYFGRFKILPDTHQSPYYKKFMYDLYTYDLTTSKHDDAPDVLAMMVDELLNDDVFDNDVFLDEYKTNNQPKITDDIKLIDALDQMVVNN